MPKKGSKRIANSSKKESDKDKIKKFKDETIPDMAAPPENVEEERRSQEFEPGESSLSESEDRFKLVEVDSSASATILEKGSVDLTEDRLQDAKEVNADDIENLIDEMDSTNAANADEGAATQPSEVELVKPRVLSGLEILNIPGPEALRETLTNSTDPLKSIEDFQRANGIHLPSLGPALPFLDLHGMDRREFHQTIFNEISEKTLAKIEKLGAVIRRADNPEGAENALRKLERLLDSNFHVVRVKALQPIVLATMKHIPVVPLEYLNEIMNDPQLYKFSSTELKRQIWEGNQSLFGDEVAPLLQDYIESKNDALFSVDSGAQAFLSLAPKMRRQSKVVTDLALYVGDKILLYDLVLQFLRTLYLTTRFMHYCTLRAELLMALHDTKVNKITAEDPCYKFTWCLDACITDKGVDEKRGVELQMFMEGISKDQEQVLGDLAMIMSDPYAVNTVMISIFKCLQSCARNDQMPKDNHELIVLFKMLNLGVHAWEMIESQVFKERKLHPELFSKFLPCVLSMMVEDKIRSVKTDIAQEQREMAKLANAGLPPGTQDPPASIPPPDPPSKPSIYFKNYVKQHAIGALVGMYYALNLVKNKDRLGLCSILPCVVNFHDAFLYEDVFLHSLVTHLVKDMAADFANDDFCMAIFDEFLFECATPTEATSADDPAPVIKENVIRHTIRLLSFVHPKMSLSRVETLLDFIKPSKQHSEITQKLHRTLSEKVSSGQRFSAAGVDVLASSENSSADV